MFNSKHHEGRIEPIHDLAKYIKTEHLRRSLRWHFLRCKPLFTHLNRSCMLAMP